MKHQCARGTSLAVSWQNLAEQAPPVMHLGVQCVEPCVPKGLGTSRLGSRDPSPPYPTLFDLAPYCGCGLARDSLYVLVCHRLILLSNGS
jgi:hypothetical protein